MSSRKNLCIHPTVSEEKYGQVVDARCRDMTADWRREKRKEGANIEACPFFEVSATMDFSFF